MEKRTKESEALKELAVRIDDEARRLASEKFKTSVKRIHDFITASRMTIEAFQSLIPFTADMDDVNDGSCVVPEEYIKHARKMLIEKMVRNSELKGEE
jgi:hypothetical protein